MGLQRPENIQIWVSNKFFLSPPFFFSALEFQGIPLECAQKNFFGPRIPGGCAQKHFCSALGFQGIPLDSESLWAPQNSIQICVASCWAFMKNTFWLVVKIIFLNENHVKLKTCCMVFLSVYLYRYTFTFKIILYFEEIILHRSCEYFVHISIYMKTASLYTCLCIVFICLCVRFVWNCLSFAMYIHIHIMYVHACMYMYICI